MFGDAELREGAPPNIGKQIGRNCVCPKYRKPPPAPIPINCYTGVSMMMIIALA
jgi:hypothetical protein